MSETFLLFIIENFERNLLDVLKFPIVALIKVKRFVIVCSFHLCCMIKYFFVSRQYWSSIAMLDRRASSCSNVFNYCYSGLMLSVKFVSATMHG